MSYSHRISWNHLSPITKVLVTSSFPTTPDMVERHVSNLKARGFAPVVEVLHEDCPVDLSIPVEFRRVA